MEVINLNKCRQKNLRPRGTRSTRRATTKLLLISTAKQSVVAFSDLEIEESDVFYANRAAAYLGAKKYERALKDCENSLNLNPKNIKAIRRAISACYETGDY